MKNITVILIAVSILASVLPAQKKEDDRTPANPPFFERTPSKKDGSTRPIGGVVRDGSDNVVAGAVVTLTNKENKQALSVVSDKAGRFVFDDCRKNVDYELRAEFQKKKSPVRLVSVYNTVLRPFIELRLEDSKPAGEAKKK
jgi:hypothetical protein